MSLITIIGRGHSGTRAISHTLTASGVDMGAPLNKSGDLIPAQAMYDACRVMAKYVKHLGGMKWDFSQLHTMDIDPEFTRLVKVYLQSVLESSAQHRGWKIPETTLVFPWIVRMFPEIKYVYWIRDPRDCILGRHVTDDLADFHVPYEKTDDVLRQRAISWKYQVELVKATPKPANWMTVRFEDFVLDQQRTLDRLQEYLGIPLEKIEVRPDAVYRWKRTDERCYFDLFREDIIANGYDLPEEAQTTPAEERA